jgi:hypothetical protein
MYLNPIILVMGYYFSTPFALLVALWGMTSARLLHALKQPRHRAMDDFSLPQLLPTNGVPTLAKSDETQQSATCAVATL